MAEEVKDVEITEEELKEEAAVPEETETEVTEEASEKAAKETAEAESEDEEEPEEEETPGPDPKDVKIAEWEDKFKRLFAEFDNFRKRSEAEKSTRFADGEKAVLAKTLDIVDNFERALDNVPDDKEAEAFAEGVRMIYKQLMSMLEGFGVKPIEAKGQTFDANLHNAVMHVEDENLPENTVCDEFQKGYMIGDKVLRYSMVKVAN